MTNQLIQRIRSGHLMVRTADEWDELAAALVRAYQGKDDELIAQLRPPFLQAWRAVTVYVLSDAFDAAGINVESPVHPWGIATLEANGSTCEPLLCDAKEDDGGRAAAAIYGGLHLLTFEEVLAGYTTCLHQLMQGDGANAAP